MSFMVFSKIVNAISDVPAPEQELEVLVTVFNMEACAIHLGSMEKSLAGNMVPGLGTGVGV